MQLLLLSILTAKIGGLDYSSPEVLKLSIQLVDKHLTIELGGGQNIPSDTGYLHRFFQ
jgi:hypothetical protein